MGAVKIPALVVDSEEPLKNRAHVPQNFWVLLRFRIRYIHSCMVEGIGPTSLLP